MNYTTSGIGICALLYGIATLLLRTRAPRWFSKMDAMQAGWGEKPGMIIHIVAYSVMPIIIGIVTIVAGIRGQSF